MICALTLAAGLSRRMGAQKLLLPYGGKTVLRHIVDQLLDSQVDQVFIVVRKEDIRIAKQISAQPVHLVTNPDPQADMLASVRCGLHALPKHCSAVLVALGDQPGITTELINQMINSFHASKKGILVPLHDEQRGHPLLFSLGYREEVLTQYDGEGLRGLVHAHPKDVFELRVRSSAVLYDMDCPDDYQREITRHKNMSHDLD
jgi:molybdenum cofactor cytidylyltransferase